MTAEYYLLHGFKPFTMIVDDRLLKEGAVLVWTGSDRKLYEAKIVKFFDPASVITVQDALTGRTGEIYIEQISFVQPSGS